MGLVKHAPSRRVSMEEVTRVPKEEEASEEKPFARRWGKPLRSFTFTFGSKAKAKAAGASLKTEDEKLERAPTTLTTGDIERAASTPTTEERATSPLS